MTRAVPRISSSPITGVALETSRRFREDDLPGTAVETDDHHRVIVVPLPNIAATPAVAAAVVLAGISLLGLCVYVRYLGGYAAVRRALGRVRAPCRRRTERSALDRRGAKRSTWNVRSLIGEGRVCGGKPRFLIVLT